MLWTLASWHMTRKNAVDAAHYYAKILPDHEFIVRKIRNVNRWQVRYRKKV